MSQPFQQLQQQLNARFPEREHVIEGALCAVLAGEHVLLLGPPGTAKSALVRALAQAFGGRYFERLLTKFSTPEELFGPISLKALEQDRYTRVTAGKLPDVEFAFVDEVFKANSAILNSLLSLVNERLFHNGDAPVSCPLVTLFGASNELPEGKELEALFDRFLLRFEVDYLLRPGNFRAVLTAPDAATGFTLSLEQLRQAHADVARVAVTDGTVDALIAIRDACKHEGLVASDRRWKKSLKLVQAAAYLAGASETTPEDLMLLSHSLWREPKERKKVAQLVGKVADPITIQATEILDVALETSARMASLRATTSERAEYISQAAKALEELKAQKQKLAELGQSAGRRARDAVASATRQVEQLHAELACELSKGLGLRSMA